MRDSDLSALRGLNQENLIRRCSEFARQAEENAALADNPDSRDVFLAVARNFHVLVEELERRPS